MRAWLLIAGGVLGAGIVVSSVACSGLPTDCKAYHESCGDSSDGGSDGTFDGAPDGALESSSDSPGCDATKSPKDEPCLASDVHAVFVDGSKQGGGSGTKGSPVATIMEGLARAKASNKGLIILCAGTYKERVVVDQAVDGVSIYGGFRCADWSYDPGAKVTVKPDATGYALELKGLVTGTNIEDIEFESKDAATDGESSIAAFVTGSQRVVLKRVVLRAGAAMKGKNGGTFANHAGTPSGGTNGNAGGGGSGSSNTCLDATTSSKGGNGGPLGGGGTDGSSVPAVGGSNAGLGGVNCTAGTTGANGLAQAGGGGAQRNGTLSSTGWTTQPGEEGRNGNPAQGGGGGGGRASLIGGGGGGAGGCGGGKGLGGQTGGSSIALAIHNSVVSLFGSSLVAKNAGSGGAGGMGQAGQPGGSKRLGACDGAEGGIGAGGSGGGGGAGGVSLGVAWVGTAPSIDGQAVTQAPTHASITLGTPGALGSKGTGASATSTGNAGQDGTDGRTGLAQAVLQIQ
jgi:hypothetical protein